MVAVCHCWWLITGKLAKKGTSISSGTFLNTRRNAIFLVLYPLIELAEPITGHTVRKWIYIGHKLPRTFDSSLSLYDINAYKKCLEKLFWTKKNNHVPQGEIEPTPFLVRFGLAREGVVHGFSSPLRNKIFFLCSN